MQNSELATWLQEHREALVALCEQGENPDATLVDNLLEAARTGQVDQLDSAITQAAHQAVVQEVPLDRFLRKSRRLKEGMWEELRQEELPASQTLALIEAVEPIFSRLFQMATRSYFEASQQMQDALASEIARLHSEAERRVMDRTADLTRANIELSKLEQARTDFISIAAHELKTPLTLIQGYANMLREMDLEAIRAMDVLEGISRGAERLSAIVEDMLDVSVIDTDALSLRIERVSLSQAINLVVGQNAHYLRERNLVVHLGDLASLPEVEADPRRLHQILSHLLNNAIKYTPDGGEVFIEGLVLPYDRSSVEENPIGSSEFVELAFRDTGIGIAPEDRERIFEKFYRVGKSTLHSSGKVKFKGAGPGLGLPIARGLVEAHGGRLWAESPGHDEVNCPGSTFHLLLPVRAVPKLGITVTWVESPAPGESKQESE
jgi:signal transduction histidine kinase